MHKDSMSQSQVVITVHVELDQCNINYFPITLKRIIPFQCFKYTYCLASLLHSNKGVLFLFKVEYFINKLK